MNKGKWFWVAMVVFAFLSVISFFKINSYWGDQHHFNGIFGFLGTGIVFGVLAIYFLIKAYKISDP
jgi:hypothetical protein